jgi:hypothetical protein
MRPLRPAALALAAALCLATGTAPRAQAPAREPLPGDDFVVREAMIPMRDGVRLYTVIVTPKAPGGPRPILLERTPYNASRSVGTATTRLANLVGWKTVAGDVIHVSQDVRGRFRSEGEYAMYRVPRGEFNRTGTDETTDAWDTIDWLVKNVEGSTGKVGVWGTSYPGWLTLAALRDPHPALAAAVPFNPVVDVWKADDWFHWGAFRAVYAFDFIYVMESRRSGDAPFPYATKDTWEWALGHGNAASLGRYLDARHEMWPRLIATPEYGQYWKDCAADRWFDAPARVVPTLVVHGLWDQEDIYGAPAVYAALERHDAANDRVFFAAGPWYHGQHRANGSALGTLDWDEDTAKRFREDVLAPFLRRFLRGEEVAPPAPVTAFESGTNRWRSAQRWPDTTGSVRLHLQAGGRASFEAPAGAGESFTEYVSDPARPVPYAPRTSPGFASGGDAATVAWRRWLVEDQRFVDGRPDVVTFTTAPLEAPLTVRGPVDVTLFAETTGTDADWVVKLIDVYPGEHAPDPDMSWYQLMVTGDIFRGRYRESLETPRAIAPDRALPYRIPLPHVSHTFLPGHRVMVQVQSSWFPLYDRNPQTFVPSIMDAPPAAYRPARQRIHHDAAHPTALEFGVVR